MRTFLPALPAVLLIAACSSAPATTHTTQPAPQQQRRSNSTTVHTIGIPPGHLPRPGRCRVWIPGRAPGHQADARSCDGIVQAAPPGSWIIYRATDDKIHVHVMDPSRRGVIYVARFYDAHGVWIRDETADEHHEAPRPAQSTSAPGGTNGNGRRKS